MSHWNYSAECAVQTLNSAFPTIYPPKPILNKLWCIPEIHNHSGPERTDRTYERVRHNLNSVGEENNWQIGPIYIKPLSHRDRIGSHQSLPFIRSPQHFSEFVGVLLNSVSDATFGSFLSPLHPRSRILSRVKKCWADTVNRWFNVNDMTSLKNRTCYYVDIIDTTTDTRQTVGWLDGKMVGEE